MKLIIVSLLIALLLVSSAVALPTITERTVDKDKLIYEVIVENAKFLSWGVDYIQFRWREGRTSGRILWVWIRFYSERLGRIIEWHKLRLVY